MPRYIVIRIFLAAIAMLSLAGTSAAAPSVPGIETEQPSGRDAVTAFSPVTASDPVIRWMVDQVTQDKVRQYNGDLSGEWPVVVGGTAVTIQTRNTYAPEMQDAVLYVGEHLASLGLGVQYDQWGPGTAPNVVAQKTGATRPDEVFMLTAHLDDRPIGSEAPGADDNASGATGILVAADVLSQFSWDCTLRFAFWTGEEQGRLGSASYAQRAKQNGENIAGVFNLDMIGWNKAGSLPGIDLHAKASMPATVDLANQAASVVSAYRLALIPEVRGDGSEYSDHASFWNQGYTAILGIEDYYPNYSDFNPNYHTSRDTLSALDLAYFTDYVKVAVAETAHMAGCLVTGTLEGQTLTSHDFTPIANAEIRLVDGDGREYTLRSGLDGSYSQALPPGGYQTTVSAYGFESQTTGGTDISAGDTSPQYLVLTAAPPSEPVVSGAVEPGSVTLTWLHVSPDTGYQIHRSGDPYFVPDAGTRVATLVAAHPPGPSETMSYSDTLVGGGSVSSARYYLVLGLNAAGANAPSSPTGVFGFTMVPGDDS